MAEVNAVGATQSMQLRKEHDSAVDEIAECCKSKDTSCSSMMDIAKDGKIVVSATERDATVRGLAVAVTLLSEAPLVDALWISAAE